ncbi:MULTISPECIES: hypothetical protein [Cysteiniphilum]|uniref:Intracellular multiplication protein IcmG n=1 Tax=Cysteiniphilum litorale TaxID=2056700 RepID=A0A8J2Z517_9GAMM|nr:MULTISPECIES: hypothetical protein [Cysteiniphilum]GGG01000.1 hypothetical protein GCM10010995_18040 [Cysteiniphilum litorale]
MSNYDFFEDDDKKKQAESVAEESQQSAEDIAVDNGVTSGLNGKLKSFKFEKIYLVYAVAGLVFVFGAYYVLGTLFGSEDKPSSAIKSQVKTQATNMPSFVKTESRTIHTENAQVDVKQLQEVKAQLDTLNELQSSISKRSEKTSIEIAQHIKKLESQQDQLLKDMQKITSVINSMQQNDQSKTLISLVSELQRQLQYMNAKEINMNEKLHLTAIIDGIAWLEDKKGRSFTVKEGSQLEGYGKVLKIDSQTYKVYTASGFVFE